MKQFADDVDVNETSSGPSDSFTDRFILDRKLLGRGGCGTVYTGQIKETGAPVAIKMERIQPHRRALLEKEKKMYDLIWRMFPNDMGFPRIHFLGEYGDRHVLVMSRLGKSLHALNKESGRQFSIKTIFMIAIQALERLEVMHTAGLVHRDVKPDNMATGLSDVTKIYFLDLGISNSYIDKKTGQHTQQRHGHMSGTVPFASENVHENVTATRRDDLESLGYSLVCMFKGYLPWYTPGSRGKGKHHERHLERSEVQDIKRQTTAEELCSGMPKQMKRYFKLVKTLRFTETPHYECLERLFLVGLSEGGYTNDGQFDWV